MDIYLTEVSNKKETFRFPSLPESIKVKTSTNFQSYSLISKGILKFPKGSDAKTISWKGVFFGPAKKRENIIREWISPAECKSKLEAWREKGTVLRLLVSGTNINYDVTIDNFEYEEYGGYGNAEYSISFYLYQDLKIYTTDELKIQKFVRKVVTRTTPAPSRTYTVVSGDNLWSIARKFYGGNGSTWERIYNANASVIESTANRYRGGRGSDHGHWIYPGTVLTIP